MLCSRVVAFSAGISLILEHFTQESMARSELGNAPAKPACRRNLKEMLDVLQRSIYFVRKLTASNVLEWLTTKHSTCQLVRRSQTAQYTLIYFL